MVGSLPVKPCDQVICGGSDSASRRSNKCVNHYSACRRKTERLTGRWCYWCCLGGGTQLLGPHEHTEESVRTGETNRWFSSALSSRWTKFSTLQVGQKYQESGHINQHLPEQQWVEYVLLLIVSEPIFRAEQLGFNSLLRLHEPRYSKIQ